MGLIKAVIAKPLEAAKEVQIGSGLKCLQTAVEGIITGVDLGIEGTAAYVNDEGILLGLPWNRRLGPKFFVAGNLIVVGIDEEGKSKSLNKLQIADVVYFLNHKAQFMIPTPSSIEELERLTGRPSMEFYVYDEKRKVFVNPETGEEREP